MKDFVPSYLMDTGKALVLDPVTGQVVAGPRRQKFFKLADYLEVVFGSMYKFVIGHRHGDPRVVQWDMADYHRYLRSLMTKFSKYPFNQVLKYDFNYRMCQLQMKFRWGTFMPDLVDRWLVRALPATPYVEKQVGMATKQVCRRFNQGRCTLKDCRFTHECEGCQGSHALKDCPRVEETDV